MSTGKNFIMNDQYGFPGTGYFSTYTNKFYLLILFLMVNANKFKSDR